MNNDTDNSPSESIVTRLRRWLPAVAIGVVALIAAVIVVTSGDGDDGPAESSTTTDSTDDLDSDPADDEPDAPDDDPLLEDGFVTWAEAEGEGRTEEFDWGERCDTTRGTYAYPNILAGDCVALWEGDNGGATSTGVTGETITIAVYVRPQDDPVMNFLLGPIQNDDTPDELYATYEGLVELYGSYFETYGRSIELVRFDATGRSNDQVAAIADAEMIAQDIQPFMVWGTPALQADVFAEALAANGVMCACGNGALAQENYPFLHTIQKSADQTRWSLAEYIGKRLAGDNAVHSPDYADQPRRFAYVYIETGEQSNEIAEDFRSVLSGDWGVELARMVPYQFDPNSLQEQAVAIIGGLKADGITSVIFTGAPIAPRDFTVAATEQNYFPEWILSGTSLVDTNVFARSFDQAQWANAFGLSNTAVPIDREEGGPSYLYRWFHGDLAPGDDTIGAMWEPAQTLRGIQGAGPELSPQTYMDRLMESDPVGRGFVTSPSLSWGSDKGIWPDHLLPDVQGVDDSAEIWWDPDTEGPDELGNVGTGVYQYVDGGRRYLPGDWPEEPTTVFDPSGAVFRYDTVPDAEAVPDYPSPAN